MYRSDADFSRAIGSEAWRRLPIPPHLSPPAHQPARPLASPASVHPAPSDARVWREAFEALPAGTTPCYGLEGTRWGEIREAAIDVLDRCGEEVAALGWTALVLFGVHPKFGVGRVDFCGALMINARRVDAIGDTWIRDGSQTYRRDKPARGRTGVGVQAVDACR